MNTCAYVCTRMWHIAASTNTTPQFASTKHDDIDTFRGNKKKGKQAIVLNDLIWVISYMIRVQDFDIIVTFWIFISKIGHFVLLLCENAKINSKIE